MEFILAIIIFSLAITGLSLGIIFGRGAPQTCSGKKNDKNCDTCQRPCAQRKINSVK